MRKIEEEDKILKHKLHDVQTMHDVIISQYEETQGKKQEQIGNFYSTGLMKFY